MSTVTEKRERDEEGDKEGVPEDESSSDVSSAPSATKRAKATKNNESSSSSSSLSSKDSELWMEPVETNPPALDSLIQSFERCLEIFYQTLNETRTTEKIHTTVLKYSEDMKYGAGIAERLQTLCNNLSKKYASRLQFHRSCGRFPCDDCAKQAFYNQPIAKMHSVVHEIRNEINSHRQQKIAQSKRRWKLHLSEDATDKDCEAAEERERHMKRCHALGLPNTADANECTVAEMKQAEECKIAEERERHIKRCHKLGLPDTADANECTVAQIKQREERKIAEMKRVEEEQKALHDYHSLRCQALGLPLNSNIDHWNFPDVWVARGFGHHTSLEKFGHMEKYKQSALTDEHICDKCQTAQATIYCTNDEAYFCDMCDQNSHQDNITQKHRRENIHEMRQHITPGTDSCPKCKATFFPIHCPFGAGVDINGGKSGALIPEVVAFDAQHWDGESDGIVKCCRKGVKPRIYSDDIGFHKNDFRNEGCHLKCDCAIINISCTLCCKECGELKVQYVQPKRGEYDFDVVVEKGSERFDKYQNDRYNYHIEDVVACHCENPECSKGNEFCLVECGRCTECTTAEFCPSGRHCNDCGNSKCDRCNCCLLCKKEEEEGNACCAQCENVCSDCVFVCPCSDACKECEVVLCSREGCSGFKCYECEIHCDTFCDGCNKCEDCNGGGVDEDYLCTACRE